MTFDFHFHLYGFFIALGILVAILVIEKLKFSFKSYLINYKSLSEWDLLPWLLIPGLIGARIYHVVDYWSYYSPDLKQIFFVWQGGLGIYGGIMGGIAGLFFYAFLLALRSRHRLAGLAPRAFINIVLQNTLGLLDFVALGLPIGQAIGRLGNYFNQELYGLPTNLPWGIYIRPENRLPGWENFAKFQPLFLYESLWCIFIFLINYFLLRSTDSKSFSSNGALDNGQTNDLVKGETLLTKKKIVEQSSRKKSGFFFFNYLFLYSFGRFWLEFVRIDSWVIDGLRINQLVAAGGMLVATLFFIKYRLQFPRKFSNILFGQ